MIIYKNIPDQFITMTKKTKLIKQNIIDKQNMLLYYNNNLTKRKLNKVGINKYNNIDVSLYETPIFYDKVDEDTLKWILSFEINDIARIFVSNNIDFDDNCQIIHSKQ